MKQEITRRAKYPVGLAKRVDNRKKVGPQILRTECQDRVKNEQIIRRN